METFTYHAIGDFWKVSIEYVYEAIIWKECVCISFSVTVMMAVIGGI